MKKSKLCFASVRSTDSMVARMPAKTRATSSLQIGTRIAQRCSGLIAWSAAA